MSYDRMAIYHGFLCGALYALFLKRSVVFLLWVEAV
jgi:hypothetical protein